MTVRRIPNTWSLLDVFDRVLDKGIVIDAWVRMSVVGIDLVTVEARIVVASFTTYLSYANALNYADAFGESKAGRRIFVVEAGNEAVHRLLCTAVSNDPNVEIFYDRRQARRPARRRLAERRARSDVDERIRRDGFALVRSVSPAAWPRVTRWTA